MMLGKFELHKTGVDKQWYGAQFFLKVYPFWLFSNMRPIKCWVDKNFNEKRFWTSRYDN